MGCSAAAGKTGTSEGESDAWFVGYTPLLSTAVWVGHPESRDQTGFGGPTAGPIWSSYMSAALAGNCPDFPVPSSLPDLSAYTGGNTQAYSSSSSPSYTPSYSAPSPNPGKGSGQPPAPDVSAPSPQPAPAPAPAPTPAPAPPAPPGPAPRRGTGRRRRRGLSLS